MKVLRVSMCLKLSCVLWRYNMFDSRAYIKAIEFTTQLSFISTVLTEQARLLIFQYKRLFKSKNLNKTQEQIVSARH
jgi:hypothetical protein